MAERGGHGSAGTTLGDVSHDLRSGLAAATAYLDLALERLDEGQAVRAEDLRPVQASLDRLGEVAERLEALRRGAQA